MTYTRDDLRLSRDEFVAEWVEMLEKRWTKKELNKMYTELVHKWNKED